MSKKGPSKSAANPDGHPYVIEAARLLKSRGQTISFAESCTGGLLSAIFTRLPGVSDIFHGSIVAYAYPAKEDLLGVPKALLQAMGAVSLPVAKRMAEGCREHLHTTWAVSVTGIAGPGGGTPQKPVGTVCFGLCGPGIDIVAQRRFQGSRREVQLASAMFALRLLLRELGSEMGQKSRAGASKAPAKSTSKKNVKAKRS